jgi:hypothetical protein
MSRPSRESVLERERNWDSPPYERGVRKEGDMNFTIGLVLAVAAVVLAILAMVSWASSSGAKREESSEKKG